MDESLSDGGSSSSNSDDPFITKEQRKGEKQEIKKLCKLIKNGSSLNDINKYLEGNVSLNFLNYCYKKWTPLLYATVENRLDICKLLVERGCDVNFIPPEIPYRVSDMDYRLGYPELSPFMMSCLCTVCFEIFVLYLQNGGNVNSLTPRNETSPLMFLVKQEDWWQDLNHNLCSIEIQKQKLQMILERGGDVTTEDKYGENVIHHLTLHSLKEKEEEEEEEEKEEEEEEEKEEEEEEEEEKEHEQSTLPQHLEKNEIDDDEIVILEIIQIILDQGIDVNKRNLICDTPLRTATKQLQRKRMSLFIINGADVNESRLDKSLIHELGIYMEDNDLITQVNFEHSLKVLLEAGLDINITTFTGDTILHRLADQFLSKAKIKIILQNGGDVNKKNLFGYTPLHTCFDHRSISSCNKKKLELIGMLLDGGAEINTKTVDGLTPLMTIVRRNCPELLSLTLDRNAYVNDVDKFGRTALHHCIITAENKEIFEMLIDCKIDPDVKDVLGKKAVYYTRFLDKDQRKYFQENLGEQEDSEGLDQLFEYKFKHKELKEYFKRYEFLQVEKITLQRELNKQLYGDATAPKNIEQMKELFEGPGIGSVCNFTETSIINNKIEQLMKNLCSHLKENCVFGYQYKSKLSGSVSEDTKVGFPDEYDYLLMLEGLRDQVTPEENQETRQGYVMLKLKQDLTNEQLSTGGYFDAEKFNLYFSKLVCAAIGSVFTRSKNDFYLLKFDQILIGKAAFSLELEYPSLELGDIKIAIDLVPVVRLPLEWSPNHFNKSTLKKGHLYVALMKQAKGRKERLRFSIDNQLRISTSLIETRIISQELPPQIKDAFIALKAICNYTNNGISTYAIKNAVMSYAKGIGKHEIENKNVFDLMLAILLCYSTFSFFFPELKIVDGSHVQQMGKNIGYLTQFLREIDSLELIPKKRKNAF